MEHYPCIEVFFSVAGILENSVSAVVALWAESQLANNPGTSWGSEQEHASLCAGDVMHPVLQEKGSGL